MTANHTNGTNRVQYVYDALGRRISRTCHSPFATNEVHFIYDGDQVVADVATNGVVLRTYVWGAGIDNLLSFTDCSTSNTYYALKDHLNSVIALVGENGNVVESYEYDAWGKVLAVKDGTGNVLSQSAVGNRYLWQGREYDFTTSFYYFRARWYDPVAGRWLSNDPIGISGGLNMYVFCGNNPVNFVDPMGLFRFGKRPLKGLPWMPGPSLNPVDDFFNTELSHEHGFFEDECGGDIGFGPNGRFSGEDSGKYPWLGDTHYDDALMREALRRLKDGKYSNWPWDKNNCQDWAERLRQEYKKIQNERQGQPHIW